MSRDHWDAILASAPLNATAAAVTSRSSGIRPLQALSPEHSWEAPPRLATISAALRADPGFVDLTGRRVGRLLVLGLVDGAGKNGAMWACRCACGRYVGRKTKNLKGGTAIGCNECTYTDKLRKDASGNNARQRAESPEARKWKTPEELATVATSPAPESR
jgi:hypothetical protein